MSSSLRSSVSSPFSGSGLSLSPSGSRCSSPSPDSPAQPCSCSCSYSFSGACVCSASSSLPLSDSSLPDSADYLLYPSVSFSASLSTSTPCVMDESYSALYSPAPLPPPAFTFPSEFATPFSAPSVDDCSASDSLCAPASSSLDNELDASDEDCEGEQFSFNASGSNDQASDSGGLSSSGGRSKRSRPRPIIDAADKRQRNKESASQYRKRRKVYVSTLENSVKALENALKERDSRIEQLEQEQRALRAQLTFRLKPDEQIPPEYRPGPPNAALRGQAPRTKSKLISPMFLQILVALLAIFALFWIPGSQSGDSAASNSGASFAPTARRLLQFDDEFDSVSSLNRSSSFFTSSVPVLDSLLGSIDSLMQRWNPFQRAISV